MDYHLYAQTRVYNACLYYYGYIILRNIAVGESEQKKKWGLCDRLSWKVTADFCSPFRLLPLDNYTYSTYLLTVHVRSVNSRKQTIWVEEKR